MKFRRTTRTILTTLLVLTVFTTFIVWHNKPPHQLSASEKQALIKQLSLQNPEFVLLLKKLGPRNKNQGFYVLATRSQIIWPDMLSRACYADPLAAGSMVSTIKTSPSEKVTLVRYRSVEDFLFVLDKAEQKTPGSLRNLNFRHCQIIPEPTLAISFKLVFSIIIAVSGLLFVKIINK